MRKTGCLDVRHFLPIITFLKLIQVILTKWENLQLMQKSMRFRIPGFKAMYP